MHHSPPVVAVFNRAYRVILRSPIYFRVFPNAVLVCIPPWQAGEYRKASGPPL